MALSTLGSYMSVEIRVFILQWKEKVDILSPSCVKVVCILTSLKLLCFLFFFQASYVLITPLSVYLLPLGVAKSQKYRIYFS